MEHELWLCSKMLCRLTHERLELCFARSIPFIDMIWVRVARRPTCRGRGVYLRHYPRAQQKDEVVVLIDVNSARGTGYQGVLLCSIYSHQSMPETGKIRRMSKPCPVPFLSFSIRIFHLVQQYCASNTCCPTMKRYKHVLEWKKDLKSTVSSFNIRTFDTLHGTLRKRISLVSKGIVQTRNLATGDLLIS
jgi:hypothetical protein